MANGNAMYVEPGPKYPQVKVHVQGSSGSLYPTVAAVQAAMRGAGVPLQELSSFFEDVAASDDDNLLRTCLRWVDVDVR